VYAVLFFHKYDIFSSKLAKVMQELVRFKFILVFFAFTTYWSATILFILPENYITISLLPYKKAFDTVFFQKWGFFAPPPKYNDRLYYTYFDKSGNSSTYEVLEPLAKKKSTSSPFNADIELIEYIISNSLNAINGNLHEVFKKNKATTFIETSTLSDKQLDSLNRLIITSSYSYQSIVNYGKYIHEDLDLQHTSNYMIISFGRKNIPKFVNRFGEGKDLITFISDTISTSNYN